MLEGGGSLQGTGDVQAGGVGGGLMCAEGLQSGCWGGGQPGHEVRAD